MDAICPIQQERLVQPAFLDSQTHIIDRLVLPTQSIKLSDFGVFFLVAPDSPVLLPESSQLPSIGSDFYYH